jgi:hypothetical protein
VGVEVVLMTAGAILSLSSGIYGLLRKNREQKRPVTTRKLEKGAVQITVENDDGSLAVFRVSPQEADKVKEAIAARRERSVTAAG